MKGTILGYDLATASGEIAGDDGQRYAFIGTDLNGQISVNMAGRPVDFSPSADNRATGIYLTGPAPSTSGEKNKLVAGLLALFLGSLGIHKFYLGNTTAGVIMLLCTLFGVVLMFIPTFVIGVIAFIEAILYLIKTDEQFEEIYVRNKRAWF